MIRKELIAAVIGRVALVVVCAACARATTSVAAPGPAQPPAHVAAGSAPAGDSAHALGDDEPEGTGVAPTEVTRLAVAVFGDSTGLAADSAAAVDSGPTWDINVRPYETRARVQYYVNQFSTTAKEIVTGWLTEGSRYDTMIRAKLRAGGLPEDLSYVAMVESGYNPDAYSSAAAVGMWQFMTSTAKGAGLRVDWWIDERRDPARSTDAAVQYLASLNEEFGSLYLAAAAYNGGSGRVSRGLTQFASDLQGTSGDDIFFALADKNYLKMETRDYVPRIIASALIAKDPGRYGLAYEDRPALTYDSVRVGPAVPLASVAKAATTDLPAIVDLNRQVLRGMTPPKDSIWVHVPVGRAIGFDSAFRAIPPASLVAYTRTKSQTGETFAAVAKRVKLTSAQLVWFNPTDGKRRGALPAGTTILVPSADVLRGARAVPDPAIERYSSAPGDGMYIVQRGESLGIIAKRNQTTVGTLKQLNRLSSDVIHVGQTLRVR